MIKVVKDVTDIAVKDVISVNLRYESVAYLNYPLAEFKPELLEVIVTHIHEFNAYLMYSFDELNWSKEFKLNIDSHMDNDVLDYLERTLNLRDLGYFPELWIAIKFVKDEKFYHANDIQFNEYLPDSDIPQIDFLGIKYDGKMNVIDEDIDIKQEIKTNNRFPKWSLYNNYQAPLNKWYDDIDGIQNIVGHPCIYFKTAVKTVSHTLQTSDEKEVISIKRFKVTFPSNILPKDTMVYSEYDYTMMEESYAEISWRMFRYLFGEKAIPDIGDILFLPILNKMFKVTHVEPDEDKKFMGKIGWFNAYLAKYTENDTTIIDENMHKILHRFDDEQEQMMRGYGEGFGDVNDESVLESMQEFMKDVIFSHEEVFADTDSEKKKTTQNYTNKFKDTTTNRTPKETDSIRKSLNKRLAILSINPDKNSFPVNMYDCSKVERKRLAFEYDLGYLEKLSKMNMYPEKEISFSFNLVSIGRHTANVFEIVSDGLPIISILINRNQIGFSTYRDIMSETLFDHELFDNEYYQINFIIKQRTVIINIYLLRDETKKLVYKDLYIVNEDLFIPNKTKVDGLLLFGGKFYIGEPNLNIDNQNILTDYVNPLLEMRSFGSV